MGSTATMMQRVREVYALLVDEHGEPDPPRKMDPLVALIGTILSQNTSDTNRDAALERLDEEIGLEPARIHAADRDELEAAIRPAGLQSQKARRIQALLDKLETERGGYELAFLADMDADQARAWLTDVPGIGPKTAAVQLCFRFDHPLFPVDTHCHRIAQRFGLIEPGSSRRAAHRRMDEIVPDELTYGLHRLMITHGREVCTARDPSCETSPTCRRFCSYYEQVIEGDVDPEAYPIDQG